MNQIKRVWIPADSFYAEEESCSTRDVQVVLASDYDAAYAEGLREAAEAVKKRRITDVDQTQWDKGYNMAVTDLTQAIERLVQGKETDAQGTR